MVCVCGVCVCCVLCVLCCVSCIVLRVACGVWCVVCGVVLCVVWCAVRCFENPAPTTVDAERPSGRGFFESLPKRPCILGVSLNREHAG